MAGKLVTIATFDQAAQARLAENALTEAGIKATVSDESLIAMDWLLSGAVGGVKVQVWEEDAERAVTVLERELGEHGEGFGGEVAPEELAAQAETAPLDEEEKPEPDLQAPSTEPDPPSTPDPNSREVYARRTAFTGILILVFVPAWYFFPLASFVFLPLAFYALYLTFNAVFGPGPLSGRGWLNISVGGAAIVLTLSWFYFFSRLMLRL